MRQLDKSLWGGTEKFDSLLTEIRARRDDYEKQRFIPQAIIAHFRDIGIYRAFVPEQFGGDAKTPTQFLQVIEAIAEADGSAGWVASFGMSPAYLAGLQAPILEQIWSEDADLVFAGCAFPVQEVNAVDGGYRVTGRWPYASGCKGASLVGVSIRVPGNQALPHMAVLPVDKVTIDESSWQVQGMASTGSFDLVVDDVFVAKDWVFERGGKPTMDTNFFRYPALSFAAQVLSVTTLGIARAALNIVLAVGENASITGASGIANREYARIDIAKAEAKLRSAQAFFYAATNEAWDAVISAGTPSREQISMLRLATTNLTHECAEVVRIAYRLGGMGSSYYGNHLSRCFRDVNMPTQHAFMGEMTYQNAGAILFGFDPLPGYL